DCYQYFCVPEYGTANGRLHFHAVHFMRTLPTGSVDPNFGRRVRNRRQLNSLQNTWPYGYSMPIAVRYTQEIGRAGSAGMPRPISYAVFCLKKKIRPSSDFTGRASSMMITTVVRKSFDMTLIFNTW